MSNPEWLLRAKRLAVRGMASGIRAYEIAAMLGLHPNYFSGAFHRAEGRPFRDWFRGVRVRRAKRLMRSGLSVLEAAHAVGYSDTRGLQRAFLRETGGSPSETARTHADRGA